MLTWCSRVIYHVTNFLSPILPGNLVDGILLATSDNPERVITARLADKALKSGQGQYVLRSPFRLLSNVVIATGRTPVQHITAYGSESTSIKDGNARVVYDKLAVMLETRLPVHITGKEGLTLRKQIKPFIKHDTVIRQVREDVIKAFKQAFKPTAEFAHLSLHERVGMLCMQVTANSLFHIEDIPLEVVRAVQQADLAISYYPIDSNYFQAAKKKLLQLSKTFCQQHGKELVSKTSVLTITHPHLNEGDIHKANPIGSLLVQSNLTVLVEGALLQIAKDPDLAESLRNEIHNQAEMTGFDNTEAFIQSGKNFHQLTRMKNLYKECLRYYSPAALLARYSKDGAKYDNYEIPKNSYLFVPFARIAHNPALFDNPHQFDPSRFDKDKNQALRPNRYPLLSFSHGPRRCLAADDYTYHFFVSAITTVIMNYQLHCDQALEDMDFYGASIRFKHKYYMRTEILGAMHSDSRISDDLADHEKTQPERERKMSTDYTFFSAVSEFMHRMHPEPVTDEAFTSLTPD